MYRYLLEVGGYATIAVLRGEIRLSRIETRATETTLLYIKDMMGSNFEKIKTYLDHDMETGGGECMRTENKYKLISSIEAKELKYVNAYLPFDI